MSGSNKKLIRQVLAEFIGMTLFVYVGTGYVDTLFVATTCGLACNLTFLFVIDAPNRSAVSTGEQLASSAAPTAASVARVLPISFAFGMSILVQAYSFGHVSGGHFNPAVTYCLFLVGECEMMQALLYVVAQFGGATFASLLLWGSVSDMNDGRQEVIEQVIGNPPFGLGANGLNPALSSGNGFLLEFMGTLVLCVTVLMTCLHKKGLAQGSPNLAPLAIGFAVFLAHVVLVPLTGCGINPARTFGPAAVNTIAGANVWEDNYWIYFVGPFTASMVAAVIFHGMANLDEAKADDESAASVDNKKRRCSTIDMDVLQDRLSEQKESFVSQP